MGKFLARISSSLGESITFEYQDREDVLGALNVKNIIVRENGSPLKTINFKYSYSQVSSNEYNSEYSDVAGKRLFLDSLNFIGQNGGKESYGFNYIDKNSLPPRLSYAKDRFGFFNGKRNICLIPKPDNNNVTAVLLGIPAFGDRTPNGTYAQIGLLNKISFPTGGVDSILFEPHIVTNENAGCSRPPFYMSGESAFKQIARFQETTTIVCPQKVTLHFACTAIGEADYDDQYYVTSVDVYDSMNNLIFSGSAGKNEVKNVQISLSPGNYTFKLAVKGPSWGNLEIDFSGIDAAPFKEVGGLRVKEIQKKDNNEIKEVISYSYAVNGVESPNVADPMPFYNSTFELILSDPALYTEYMSFSFFDFPQYSGVSVGYDNVVEKFGRNAENGSATHKFTNFTDKIAEIVKKNLIPGAPLSYDARKSGQEFYTSFLDGNGNLKKEIWKYYNDKPELKRTKVYYIARNRNPTIVRTQTNPSLIIGVDINKFELSSAWNKLDSVKTIVYLENGQTQKLVEKESYDYGNLSHLLVTTQRKVGSDGRITTMNVTYPDDYPVGDLLLNSMSANNLKDYPIELTRYVEENGIKKMIGGDLINYSLDGKGKMNSLMNLELTSPLLAENFKFSNKVVGQLPSVGPNSNFAPSDLYQTKIRYQEYDQWGNPLQGTQEDGVVVSYLWGYNGRYLWAKITNASLDDVKNVLGGDAVLAQLNIVNVSDVFVNQKVDLLRQGLPKSRVSSYTYAPSVGITSQTDQKGQITYYEYDDFQRLKHLKDQHGNIIKSYDYHYKP